MPFLVVFFMAEFNTDASKTPQHQRNAPRIFSFKATRKRHKYKKRICDSLELTVPGCSGIRYNVTDVLNAG